MSHAGKAYKIGQLIEGKILRVDGDFVLISLDGQFIRMSNQSNFKLTQGQTVKLVVDSIDPVRVKFFKREHLGRIDIHR